MSSPSTCHCRSAESSSNGNHRLLEHGRASRARPSCSRSLPLPPAWVRSKSTVAPRMPGVPALRRRDCLPARAGRAARGPRTSAVASSGPCHLALQGFHQPLGRVRQPSHACVALPSGSRVAIWLSANRSSLSARSSPCAGCAALGLRPVQEQVAAGPALAVPRSGTAGPGFRIRSRRPGACRPGGPRSTARPAAGSRGPSVALDVGQHDVGRAAGHLARRDIGPGPQPRRAPR